jgi:hypothetical protein
MLLLGVGGAAVLALGGGAAALWTPGWKEGRLTAEGEALMSAVALAVLDGMLPTDPAQQQAALIGQMRRLQDTVNAFPAPIRAEIADLLSILASAPGRRWLAGLATPWAQASVPEVSAALNSMRRSGQALRLQAFHALRDLTHGAFYAEPAHWALLGYPGPPKTG